MKPIQIAVLPEGTTLNPGLFALCDDGSILLYSFKKQEWGELKPIPGSKRDKEKK